MLNTHIIMYFIFACMLLLYVTQISVLYFIVALICSCHAHELCKEHLVYDFLFVLHTLPTETLVIVNNQCLKSNHHVAPLTLTFFNHKLADKAPSLQNKHHHH